MEVGGGACPTEMLKPGEQAVYDWQSGVLDRREVDVRLYTSWKDGYYMFEMERLDDMMNTLLVGIIWMFCLRMMHSGKCDTPDG